MSVPEVADGNESMNMKKHDRGSHGGSEGNGGISFKCVIDLRNVSS